MDDDHSTELSLIEDEISRQLSFAKRRNGIIKKALELYMVCGVDSLFITFSPSSGRVSYFCGDKRVEDILARFAELPENIRRGYISDAEYFELLDIINELREGTERRFRNDRDVQVLQSEITRVKEELKSAKSELSGKFEPLPQSIRTIQEANNAEANLEQALARIQDCLKQLVTQQVHDASNSTFGFTTGANNPQGNFSSEALLAVTEHLLGADSVDKQDQMANQAGGAGSSQVTFSERDPPQNLFLDIHSPPPQHSGMGSFTRLLMSVDTPESLSPFMEILPQAPASPFPLSSQPSEQNNRSSFHENLFSIYQDGFFNAPISPGDHTTEVTQLSDPIESSSGFLFPSASQPSPKSPNYQTSPQIAFGGSGSSMSGLLDSPHWPHQSTLQPNPTQLGQNSSFPNLLTPVSKINDMLTDEGLSAAFLMSPNPQMNLQGELPWDQDDFRTQLSDDQNNPLPVPRSPTLELYDPAYMTMGLAVDPHIRILDALEWKDGDNSNQHQTDQ